jgi:hypothetical protein
MENSKQVRGMLTLTVVSGKFTRDVEWFGK